MLQVDEKTTIKLPTLFWNSKALLFWEQGPLIDPESQHLFIF